MNKEYAKYLLDKTKEDYNKIALKFSETRDYIPEDMKILEKYANFGDSILDLGCGNGRLSELFTGKNINYIGVDISEKIIDIAKEKYLCPVRNFISNGANLDFQTVDFLKLPFPDNSFDKVYCLSVFHHIPSKDFRLQFLGEIKRVLKPEGVLILTVWNFWKGRAILNIFKYIGLKIFSLVKLDFYDIFFPFKDANGQILATRYFHCFRRAELRQLFKEAKFEIKESGILKRGKYENIYVVAKK